MTTARPSSSSRSGHWPAVMGRVVAADHAQETFESEDIPICVGRGKYQVICQIGRGSFGNVFLARSIKTGKEVALKVELANCARPKVPREVALYNAIGTTHGIPRLLWHGTEGQFNMMVMQLVGANLEDLFSLCNGRFSPYTALRLASQMLPRISHLHSKGFIHGDLKPENFAMGLGQHGTTVYLLDFGLTRRFIDPATNAHIPYAENKNLTGTARYASINTHLGIERSRRDDLESLAYIVIYFIRGGLPWQGIKGNTKKEKYRRIGEKKVAIPIEELTRGYPAELAKFLRYVRALRFEQKPNYNYLGSLIKAAIQKVKSYPTHLGDASTPTTTTTTSSQPIKPSDIKNAQNITESQGANVEIYDWNIRALELCEKGRVNPSRNLNKWGASPKLPPGQNAYDAVSRTASPQLSWYTVNATNQDPNAQAAAAQQNAAMPERTRSSSPMNRPNAISFAGRQMLSYAATKRRDLILQGKYGDGVSQGVILQRHRKIRLMTYLLSLAMAYPNHPVFGAFHMGSFDSGTETEESYDHE